MARCMARCMARHTMAWQDALGRARDMARTMATNWQEPWQAWQETWQDPAIMARTIAKCMAKGWYGKMHGKLHSKFKLRWRGCFQVPRAPASTLWAEYGATMGEARRPRAGCPTRPQPWAKPGVEAPAGRRPRLSPECKSCIDTPLPLAASRSPAQCRSTAMSIGADTAA